MKQFDFKKIGKYFSGWNRAEIISVARDWKITCAVLVLMIIAVAFVDARFYLQNMTDLEARVIVPVNKPARVNKKDMEKVLKEIRLREQSLSGISTSTVDILEP